MSSVPAVLTDTSKVDSLVCGRINPYRLCVSFGDGKAWSRLSQLRLGVWKVTGYSLCLLFVLGHLALLLQSEPTQRWQERIVLLVATMVVRERFLLTLKILARHPHLGDLRLDELIFLANHLVYRRG